jgi:hypothetical protein
MSVAYILNQDYSYIDNTKLNQELEVETSIKAPVHLIDDTVSISKNPTSGGMILNASVVEATVIETDSINATTGVFTSAINPLVGDTTETISVNGNIDLDGGFGLKNVSTLTVDGSSAVAGYVLSTTDTNGTLQWKQDATANQSLADVLSVGNTANTTINMNLNQISNCSTLRVNNMNNVSGTGQINMNCNLNFGNPNQSMIFCGRLNTTASDTTGQAILGRALNRYTGVNSFAMTYDDNSNIFRSDSVADLIDFHDFKSNQGKIYIVNSSNVEKFAADETKVLTDKLQTSLIQPTAGQSGTVSIDSFCNITNQLQAQTNIRTKALYMDRASQFQGSLIQMFDKNNNAVISLIADDANGQINCGQLNPTYRQERTLWVSSNNTNANKTGSFENPFSTIQAAINYAESLYNNTYWYINVMPGTYTEELTITKKVFITGSAPSNPDANSVGCQLNGSITVSVDTNDADMFNNVVSISNLFITGSIECNSANTNRSVLILTDCYIYQDNGNGRLIHYNPDATDGRLWLFNCRFLDQSTTATLPLIEIDKGMLKMFQCAVIGSGNENILKLGSTSRIDSVVLCSFTSSTSSTIAEPIVELSSTGATLTFSQCAFIYSNSADKSAFPNSCGILLNEALTVFNPVLNLQNCAFSLLGTSPTTNFAVQDANFGTAKAAIILVYGNNSIFNTAYQIKGVYNVNKFSNQTVDSLKTPLLETTNIYVNGSNGTANQVLQKDGSNNLVWGAGGSGGGENLEATLAIGNSAGAYSINMNNQDITSIKDLYPTNINVGSSVGTANQVLGKNGSNALAWIDQSGGGAFSPSQTLYVDASNIDPSPDGSINNPYANIASAVAYAEANFDVTKYWVVNIAPGSYGTFTITKPRIYFNGVNDNSNYIISNDAPCKITGDVIISCQTAGGNNPTIAFDGLYFNNASIYDRNASVASIQNYNLVLNNCQMEVSTAKDSIIHLQPNSASNLLITNSRFSSTVALSSTRMLNLVISFSRINVQNSVFFTSQNNICLYFESIAHLEEVRNCTFTNSTNNNTPLAMIRGSTNNSAPVSIIQNQFIYSTNTGRVANSRAIFFGGTTFQLQCFLINNFFNLLGFQNDSFVAGDGSPAAVNGCRFNYFGNCSAVGTTNLIEGVEGEGKRALLTVS